MVHVTWFKDWARLLFSRSGAPWVKWLALGGFAFFLIKGLIWLGVLAVGIMVAFQW